MIAGAVLGSATPAAAADWRLLTTSNDNGRVVLYIDAASLEDSGGRKLVRLERVHETKSEHGAKQAMSRIAIDCAKRLIGPRELRSWDDEGRELHDLSALIEAPEMTEVPPGTVYEDVLAFVCERNREYDHLADDLTPLSDAPEVFKLMRVRGN
jgi:hypothetical protein